jgi:hypothetical protein
VSNLVWVVVVTAGAAAVYAALAARWKRPSPAQRRVAAELPGVEIDPFHALAAAHNGPGAMDDAAVATLLLDDLVAIDAEGMMALTERGRDPDNAPAHPVSVAWLACIARADAPDAVSQLRRDPRLRQWCEGFVREQDRRQAEWMRPAPDRASTVAGVVTLLLGFFYAALLVFAGAHRPAGGLAGGLGLTLLLGLLFAAVLGWFVQRWFPDPPELFREYCAGLPPHPAVEMLDPDQQAQLQVSKAYEAPGDVHRQQVRDAYDSDSGGF